MPIAQFSRQLLQPPANHSMVVLAPGISRHPSAIPVGPFGGPHLRPVIQLPNANDGSRTRKQEPRIGSNQRAPVRQVSHDTGHSAIHPVQVTTAVFIERHCPRDARQLESALARSLVYLGSQHDSRIPASALRSIISLTFSMGGLVFHIPIQTGDFPVEMSIQPFQPIHVARLIRPALYFREGQNFTKCTSPSNTSKKL